MWYSWVSFALGLWFFISGIIPGLQGNWNMIILGLAAAVFGFLSYKTWQGIAIGIIGLWFFLSAIWFHLVLPWNFIILGIVMAALAIWDALSHHTPHTASHSPA